MEKTQDKPTKAFLEQQIQAAREAMKVAQNAYIRNSGIAEFCEEMVKRGIFIEEEVK